MNALAQVDLYCERMGTGLFAEPFNALSNLAFVVAGLWLLAWLSGLRHAPRAVVARLEALAGLIVLIGVCSGAFHVFATVWAQALDVLSIALFIYAFAVCYARDVLDLRWSLAWMAAPAFWAFGTFVQAPFSPGDFNGSVGYFPALAALVLMALGQQWRGAPGAGGFALAAGVFTVSLAARSVDLAWCARWIWGTHALWHVLNALTLACALRALAQAAGAGLRPAGSR